MENCQKKLIRIKCASVVGLPFLNKLFFILKKKTKVVETEVSDITRSLEQYSDLNFEERIRDLGEYENVNANFYDWSENNQKA